MSKEALLLARAWALLYARHKKGDPRVKGEMKLLEELSALLVVEEGE